MLLLGIAVLVAVVGTLGVGYANGRREEAPSPEDEVTAAVELHAIRRRLDVALLAHQSRVDATRARRVMAADLDRLADVDLDEES
jgi:hypothetical protein